jgi:single-strand DNA-binding protein
MKSLNRVSLLGNVGKEPEIRTTPNGNKVANMSVATTESYKDKSGNWQDSTEWHKVQGWAYIADQIEKLDKGSKVYVEGKIKTRSYEDKQGQTKYITEIVASGIVNLNQNDRAIDSQPNYDKFEDTDKSDIGDDVPF